MDTQTMTNQFSSNRSLAINYARSLIGAKWRHQGRSPWAVDCIGLLVLSLREAGLELEDTTHYSREPWNDNLQAELRKRFGEPVENYQPGDIAVFKAFSQDPSHVGLIAESRHGGLSLIHSRAGHKVMEHGFDKKWQRMFVEAYSPWAS